jgi:hypothetical protein
MLLVSYVFAGVHFLHFGELKMRFLQITRFRYKKYILMVFGFWDVSNQLCDPKYKARVFSG